MVDTIAHRGPDGARVWSNGPVGLGHRMLHTTPESLHEQLPFTSRCGNYTITADARIDNRDELIQQLGLDDRPREYISDSAIVLAAYQRWGERCPEKLLGDFAFAIWDACKRQMFCARDHFGVRPFYYYCADSALVFASEIKALWSLAGVPRRLNEEMIAYYMVTILEETNTTFYKDIAKLSPGHSVTIGDAGMQIRAYWALDISQEIRLGSDEEYAEEFRALFFEAVRCRLRSAFPVGSMLSGGMDSSSIVCTAREILAQRGTSGLHTFSAIFPTLTQCDERGFIDAVVKQGGLEPHYVHADELNPLDDFERVLWHQDGAFWSPNQFMHLALFATAQKQGVRVVLDGIDGDTVVSHGIAYLRELTSARRWRNLWTEISGLSRNFQEPPHYYISRHCIVPFVPYSVRKVWRTFRGGNRPWWATIVNPEFSERINLVDHVHSDTIAFRSPARTAREDQWQKLTNCLQATTLEEADKAALMFSVRPSYPFYDKRLVEFCLALPPEQKLRDGWSRFILRRAMDKLLPHEIQWRGGKIYLSPMLARALMVFNRDLLEATFLNHIDRIEQWVDLSTLRETYRQYLVNPTSDTTCIVWKAVNLALWLDHASLPV